MVGACMINRFVKLSKHYNESEHEDHRINDSQKGFHDFRKAFVKKN